VKPTTAFYAAFALLVCGTAASLRIGDKADRLTGTLPLSRPLAESIPLRHAGWTGVEQPMPEKTVEMLKVDDYVSRLYTDERGEELRLYVAYHGNKERGMQTYYHNATVCFPSQGWTYEKERTRTSTETIHDLAKEVPVCRYLFSKGGDRLSVMTFFKINDEMIDQSPRNKPLWSVFDRALPEFDDSPGTFVQVQIIAAVGPGGEFEAADLQSRFLREFGKPILDGVHAGPAR
jgi:EpsI family protein